MVRFNNEYPHLEAALSWFRDRGDTVRLCRMVMALHPVWNTGYTSLMVPVAASIDWIDTALDSEGVLSPAERGTLMLHECLLVYSSGPFTRAVTLDSEAVKIARDEHDDFLPARCLGALAVSLGFTRESLPGWEAELECGRRVGDDYFLGQVPAAYAPQNDSAAYRLARAARPRPGSALKAGET